MPLSRTELGRLAWESRPLLHRLAMRLTKNASDADDLIQETFCRALRYSESFQMREWGIGPWLTRILRNVHGNRARGEPAQVDVGILETLPAATQGWQAWTEKSASDRSASRLREELDQRLTSALRHLPDCFRMPLLLWSLDGLTYAEISGKLGIPVGTVLSRLARGRAALAERLGDLASEQRLGAGRTATLAHLPRLTEMKALAEITLDEQEFHTADRVMA